MPIGILGGTFDPVHKAHLAIARGALDSLQLSGVRWIPTGSPVHRAPPVAQSGHRVAMLELALAGEPGHTIDARELSPAASGYTFDTLQALRGELGRVIPIILLMGTDQAAKLDQWHRWRELLSLAHLGLFARPGASVPMTDAVREEFERRRTGPEDDWRQRPAGAVIAIDWAPLAISASEIRERLARGESVAEWLPDAVLSYIQQHHLYRETA